MYQLVLVVRRLLASREINVKTTHWWSRNQVPTPINSLPSVWNCRPTNNIINCCTIYEQINMLCNWHAYIPKYVCVFVICLDFPCSVIYTLSLSNLFMQYIPRNMHTVFALLCFVVVIHWLIFPYPSGLLHWHALWQSNDCPSPSKATLMNMDKYFMWIHYERLHNHNKAKHNKTVCIFLGIYCTYDQWWFIFVVHNHVTHIDICLNTKLNVFVIITAINCN